MGYGAGYACETIAVGVRYARGTMGALAPAYHRRVAGEQRLLGDVE